MINLESISSRSKASRAIVFDMCKACDGSTIDSTSLSTTGRYREIEREKFLVASTDK